MPAICYFVSLMQLSVYATDGNVLFLIAAIIWMLNALFFALSSTE